MPAVKNFLKNVRFTVQKPIGIVLGNNGYFYVIIIQNNIFVMSVPKKAFYFSLLQNSSCFVDYLLQLSELKASKLCLISY